MIIGTSPSVQLIEFISFLVWTQHLTLLNKRPAAKIKHLAEIIHIIHVQGVFMAFVSTDSLLGSGRENGWRVCSGCESSNLGNWSSESQCERTWLTLGWQQGKENKCTLPKSSAEASRDASCDLHTALMSVPSAPSGQIPEEEEKRSSSVEFESKRAALILRKTVKADVLATHRKC